MLGHADGRESFCAHPEAHLDIWRGRARHGIGDGIEFGLVTSNFHHHFFLLLVDKQRVGVPRGLGLGHPKRRDLHLVLWSLGLLSTRFTGGTAHQEFAAWDRDHFKLDTGSANLLLERLHGRLELVDKFFDRLIANIDNHLWRRGEALIDLRLFASIAAGRLEFQPLRPGGTLHDPVTQQVELLLWQRAALVGWRHQVIIVSWQRHGLV